MEADGLRDVDLVCAFTEKLLSRSISLREFVQLLGYVFHLSFISSLFSSILTTSVREGRRGDARDLF